MTVTHQARTALAGYRVGVISMLIALVLSQWLSDFLRWPSPLEPVAETVVLWTPLPVATFLLLNVHDFVVPLAFLGACAIGLLVGGLAGVVMQVIRLAYPFPPLAAGAFACLCWFWTFGSTGWASEASLMAFFAIGLLTWPWLGSRFPVLRSLGATHAPLPNQGAAEGGSGRRPDRAVLSRREVLLDTGVVVTGVSLSGLGAWFIPLVEAEPAGQLFRFHPPANPPGFRITGLSSAISGTDDFYINSKDLFGPRPANSQLTIDGLVGRRLSLSQSALRRWGRVDRIVTLECVDNPVGGPLMNTALWSGVPLRDLLMKAGPTDHANFVIIHAFDGYSESIPLAEALSGDILMAYGMNGRLLASEHGFPLRLVVPGLYGFKSVKWVSGLTVSHSRRPELWSSRGWTSSATVRTTTRIDVANRRPGGWLVAGVAYAGRRGVGRVQVRFQSDSWFDAELAPELSRSAWRLWRAEVETNRAGTIEARATDGAGSVQTGVTHGSYPDGATGYAHIRVKA